MTARRSAPRVLAAVLATGLLVAAPAVTHADVASDGLWYFDALNVQAAHDAGYTGEGVTIAVLDSAINLDVPTLRGADVRLGEQPECYADGAPVPVESADVAAAEHATNVVSLIVGTGAGEAGSVGVKGVAPDASVIFYRVGRTGDIRCDDASGAEGHGASVGLAIDAAIDAGADIISLSLSFGPGAGVLEAVARGVGLGVIFVTALDNQDGPIGLPPWSSELNGGVGVQAIDSSVAVLTHEIGFEGERVPNTDPHVDVVAPGVGILFQGTAEAGWAGQRLASGTSLATPIVAGFLAVTAQKYPQATSNQLLQSLIHNTGAGDHELTYDPNQLLGYGVASLTQMLKVDPTTYPDVNPLFEPDGEPDAEEVAEALATPTPEPTDPGGGGVAGLVTPLIVVGAVLVVLVVAVLVIVLVVLGRRRRT